MSAVPGLLLLLLRQHACPSPPFLQFILLGRMKHVRSAFCGLGLDLCLTSVLTNLAIFFPDLASLIPSLFFGGGGLTLDKGRC